MDADLPVVVLGAGSGGIAELQLWIPALDDLACMDSASSLNSASTDFIALCVDKSTQD